MLGVEPRFPQTLTDVRLVRAAQELVEAVKVALVGILAHAAALLQQVRVDGRTDDGARVVKVNADKFALMVVVRWEGEEKKKTGKKPPQKKQGR